jgi:uncharacterized protein (TIGR02145 family)
MNRIISLLCVTTLVMVVLYSCKKEKQSPGVPNPVHTSTPVADIDGNLYDTIQIGNQIWMKQNLKTRHYRDGSSITEIEDSLTWSLFYTGAQTPAWCSCNGDSVNNAVYGKLYNWYAVTDTHNICPTGWHVPSQAEWTTLINYLGGSALAGGHLKADSLWVTPNTGATNSSGFTALPAGVRFEPGNYWVFGSYAFFWSSSRKDSATAYCTDLSNGSAGAFGGAQGTSASGGAFSVRCIKD